MSLRADGSGGAISRPLLPGQHKQLSTIYCTQISKLLQRLKHKKVGKATSLLRNPAVANHSNPKVTTPLTTAGSFALLSNECMIVSFTSTSLRQLHRLRPGQVPACKCAIRLLLLPRRPPSHPPIHPLGQPLRSNGNFKR